MTFRTISFSPFASFSPISQNLECIEETTEERRSSDCLPSICPDRQGIETPTPEYRPKSVSDGVKTISPVHFKTSPKQLQILVSAIQNKINSLFLQLEPEEERFFSLQHTHSQFFRLAIELTQISSKKFITPDLLSTRNEKFLHAVLKKYVGDVQMLSGAERQKFRKEYVCSPLRRLKNAVENRNSKSIDFTSGIVRYNGRLYQATNFSLLLPIKYTLDLRIIDSIRVLGYRDKDYIRLLELLPNSYSDLISYMYDERLLPELDTEDIKHLIDAYKAGCSILKLMQAKFYKSQRQKTITVTLSESTTLENAYVAAHRILRKINSAAFIKEHK
jgi:hypothetical protein